MRSHLLGQRVGQSLERGVTLRKRVTIYKTKSGGFPAYSSLWPTPSNPGILDYLDHLLSFCPDEGSPLPIYRQLAHSIVQGIKQGRLVGGQRLPATRELAGQLGLNRATISAAYALVEETGQIRGHVGRGSFVVDRLSNGIQPRPTSRNSARFDWDAVLPASNQLPASSHPIQINFASARPPADAFPLTPFRASAKAAVDDSGLEEVLQLGSPHGHAPLRRYLLQAAQAEGTVVESDDLLITNGCQQGLDLLARLLASSGETVLVEDPVYYGLSRVFQQVGASIIPISVGERGFDLDALENAVLRHRPRLIVVTPSFQNPTGATLPIESRRRLVTIAAQNDVIIVENDIYSQLRYKGEALPTLKELDVFGNTLLLRSYSKVSFPGLRVGWIIGPHEAISRLVEIKQTTDLHSDQLSQSVILRFAESGELHRHLERARREGAERLEAALHSCQRFLPSGTRWTRPDGGMSLWVDLPAPLLADELLLRAQERGVTYLPGRYFSIKRAHPRSLRLSFGGLTVDQIRRGIQILGELACQEQAESVAAEPAVALV